MELTQSATVFRLTELLYWFKVGFVLKILGIFGMRDVKDFMRDDI